MEVIIKRSAGGYSKEAAVDVDVIRDVHWGNVSGEYMPGMLVFLCMVILIIPLLLK